MRYVFFDSAYIQCNTYVYTCHRAATSTGLFGERLAKAIKYVIIVSQ